MPLLSRRQAFSLALGAALPSARAAKAGGQVIQWVDAWQGATRLPSTTGQIIDEALAREIIAANAALARQSGYDVIDVGPNKDWLLYRDPGSTVTILQRYVPAAPFYRNLPYPYNTSYPAPVPKAAPTLDANTAVLLSYGQSNGSNTGPGRYTAGADVWAYGGSGTWYQASDPLPSMTDSHGASLWPRIADRLIGRTMPDGVSPIRQVVLYPRNVAGTYLSQWVPGGDLHGRLIASVQDMIANGLPPTYICVSQGEAEIGGAMSGSLTASDIAAGHKRIAAALRAAGASAPIFFARTTICNLRPPDPATAMQYARVTPAQWIAAEKGRQVIHGAFLSLCDGSDPSLRLGPNSDALHPGLRYDGCHFGLDGQDDLADLWVAALTA